MPKDPLRRAIKGYADVTGINTHPALGMLSHAALFGLLGRQLGDKAVGPALSLLEPRSMTPKEKLQSKGSREQVAEMAEYDPRIRERVKNLMTIGGAGFGAALLYPLVKEHAKKPHFAKAVSRALEKTSTLGSPFTPNTDGWNSGKPVIPIMASQSWLRSSAMPVPIRQNALNLVNSAAAGRPAGLLSIGSLGKAAIRAGIGAVSGYAGSKLLGLVLGASPPTQRRMDRIGLTTGLLANTFLGQKPASSGAGWGNSFA